MGSVYKRGGRYYIRFKDHAGKWVSRSASTREDEAHRILREVERGVRAMPQEVAPAPAPVTLTDLVEDWLARRRKRGLRNVDGDKADLDRHILPQLGAMAVVDIRVRHIRAAVEAWQATELAPRSVRRIYGTMHKLFADLVVDEVITHSPCVLTKDQLPKNRDRDLTWRAQAVFRRDEVELLISSDGVPEDRRILYALLFLAGVRLGEAAGLMWSDIDDAAKPLKRLTVARSYEDLTKTQTARDVPVHPVLAAMLADWRLRGWVALMGRHPQPSDLVIPSREGFMRSRNQVRNKYHDDLKRLGLRKRRVHDARRTFITLARVDGARKDVLEQITHSGRGGIMDVYTSLPWPSLCEAVACLKVERIKSNVYRLPLAVNDDGSASGDEPNSGHMAATLVTSLVTDAESRAAFVQKSWQSQRDSAVENGGGAGSRTRVRKRSAEASTCVSCVFISRRAAPTGGLASPLSALYFAATPSCARSR
jgi:integrase